MKAIYFIKWLVANIVKQVKGFDRWMWGWIVTCAFVSPLINNGMDSTVGRIFTVWVLTFWIGYGLVYTGIKSAYRKFQAEQDSVLDHLKDSK
jgi:hypothetical protein